MEKASVSKKDNTNCCVPQCASKGSKNPELSFHKFPNAKSRLRKLCFGSNVLISRRDEWIRVLRIGKSVSSRMCVCSKHFTPSDYNLLPNMSQRPRLKPSAVPSLFLPVLSTETVEKNLLKHEKAVRRQTRYEEIKRKKDNMHQKVIGNDSPVFTMENKSSVLIAENDLPILTTESPELSSSEVSAVQALLSLQDVKKDQATQVTSGDLKSTYLLKANELSDNQLKSLTGLHSISLLIFLEDKINQEIKITNKHILPLKERIILTLMRIKLDITFSALSVFFGCSAKTVSNIFFTLIPILASILSSVIEWVSKDEVMANLPKCFADFSNVRAVLDCTEIVIQKPKCLTERIMTYSQYYGDHTIKYLMCISPGGLITFVSKGYGGRASDKLIFVNSHIIDMLEPHIDAIMTDKGFLIEDLCAENFIQLIRPPFLHKKTQFSAAEATLCRKIASARVHVERAFQKMKIFAILKSTVPYSLLPLLDNIMLIAAALTNISKPILSENKY